MRSSVEEGFFPKQLRAPGAARHRLVLVDQRGEVLPGVEALVRQDSQ